MRGAWPVLLALCALALPAQAEDGLAGRWLTEDGDGVVVLQHCGVAFCGTIDGIGEFRPDGSPPVDVHGRSRCHLTIIPDLQLEQPGIWGGHITNPDDDKTYTIQISLDPQGHLRMRGYIGIPLFGRTTIWTRYKGRLLPDCHLDRG